MAQKWNPRNTNDSPVNVTDDREAHPKFWIAAYTRPKSERKAASEIDSVGLRTYVPVQTVIRQWSDRKKKVDVVVIPGVIFIHLSARDFNTVRRHPLVTRILSLPGRKEPAPIPAEQIDNLRLLLREAGTPVDFRPFAFKVRDNVRVIRGNLKGLVGSVERIAESKSMLMVAIDLLGGALVEIPSIDLEAVEVCPEVIPASFPE